MEKGKYQSIIIACIAAVAAVICISILTSGLVRYKQTSGLGGYTVTGSASSDFESDLIVWRGSFTAYGETPRDAYQVIKEDAKLVKKYLLDSGISEDEMVFSSVDISQRYTTKYDAEGYAVGDEPDGYDLEQRLTVSSGDLDKVEAVSRDITQLIESGVEFTSDAPEYYCTTLDEVKMDLIQKATVNAKERVDTMAQGTGGGVGKLLDADLGVFQITAQNSGSGSFSYDGAFDTSSRHKTAMITVHLKYAVE